MILNRHFHMILIAVALNLLLMVCTSFAETITYEYDAQNRLASVSYGGDSNITYSYDKAGNRESKSENFGLRDIIVILEFLTSAEPVHACYAFEVNGDGKLGMQELLYIIERLAQLR